MAGSDRFCADCDQFNLEKLDSGPFELCSDARQLHDKSGAPGSARCEMCAIVWWSLRHDYQRIPLDANAESWAVVLSCKRIQGAFESIEVIAMPVNRQKDHVGWVLDGSWHYGGIEL